MDNIEYIPLGTRCSSAFVFKDNLKVRTKSFPFDWIDAPIKNLIQFVDIEKNQIEEKLTQFFSEFPENDSKHPDGTWFPHDIFPNTDYYDIMDSVKDKYIKRLERLHDAFTSGKTLFFLTIFDSCKYIDYAQYYLKLRYAIDSKCTGNTVFVSINGTNENVCLTDNNGKLFHANFYIERRLEDEQFKLLEQDIATMLLTNDYTSKYFANAIG